MEAGQLRVGLLGPLEIRYGDQPVEIPGGRARVVLATLALAAGRPVAEAALADRVWSERPPQSTRASLTTHVMRLRRVVGGDAIRTTASGYLLDLDADQVDVLRFRRLTAEAARERDPDQARRLLTEALDLWRGEPLDALDSETLQRDLVPALVEERLLALQRCIELDLAAGEHARLTGQLRELTSRHPLHEPFWRQLITALAAGGRQADALDAYGRLRVNLREQLGVDPSAELRERYQRLLAGQAAADPRAEAHDVPDAHNGHDVSTNDIPQEPDDHRDLEPIRRELPGDLGDFAGRELELHELIAAAPTAPKPQAGASHAAAAATTVVISAIDGMAGVGKTTLAIHAAHQLTETFPDGQLFIDLHDRLAGPQGTDPAAALDTLLRAVGVPGELIPPALAQRSALWRSRLAGRRMLVLLDNAVSAAQVQPMLPGSAGSMAIVTSRRRLIELDGARHLSLDLLPADDALALFTRIVEAQSVDAEPEAAADVLRLCGYLPLAIRIAAARLDARPAWSIRYLAQRLDDQRRLSELASGDRSVAAVFAISYEQLPPGHRQLFRLLGLHPGPDFDVYLAAAAAGLDPATAEDVLEDLLDVNLLRQRTPGRYEFHDLLRDHASATALSADSAEERRAAVGRMLDYYLRMTELTDDLLAPGRARNRPVLEAAPDHVPPLASQAEALDWCERELANVLAAVTRAADASRPQHQWLLPLNLFLYYNARRGAQVAKAIYHAAHDAAERAGDQWARAETARHLGWVYWDLSDATEAIHYQHLALEIFRAIGDESGEAVALGNLGFSALSQSRYDEAADLCREVVQVCRRVGNLRGEAIGLFNLGYGCTQLGRFAEAIRHLTAALELFRRIDDQRMEAATCAALGNVRVRMSDYGQALLWHRRALDLAGAVCDFDLEAQCLNDMADGVRAAGDRQQGASLYRDALERARVVRSRLGQARAHDGLGHCLLPDDPDAACQHWLEALALFEELNHPRAADVRAALEAMDETDRAAALT
jgi:DNA-binding SARP family transcriptional activator/tetratricopeptide (TPR) repeat protein